MVKVILTKVKCAYTILPSIGYVQVQSRSWSVGRQVWTCLQPPHSSSHCSWGRVEHYQLRPIPPCISPTLKTPESAADSSGTDNVSAESTATRSPNGNASLETADSLQHLDDADSVKFKVKDEEPVVKHIIKGKVGWAPIRVTNHCSMRERSIASVDYLKKCKKISIVYNEDFGWRASIHSGSAWFSTPIASRTRSRTSRDIT